MLRNWKLATILAIAISAGGTMDLAQAGGFGGFGGGGGGRSFGGHSNHGHSHGGGIKFGGNSGGGSNIIRSGNFGGVKLGSSSSNGNSASKVMPRNTGVVGPRIGNSNGNSGIGIKLPGVGSIGSKTASSSKSNSSSKSSIGNVLKSNGIASQVLKSQGINLGGSSNKSSSHNHSAKSSHHHDHHHGHHDHHHHHGHHHHGHHHHSLPLVFSLPSCQPNYCPPPCPPIYYPQPYPVAVPVPVPVGDPNLASPADANAVPAAPPMGLPMETRQALQDTLATETPAADSNPAASQPVATAADVVNNDVPLPQIPIGATLTLKGTDLTDKEGQVVLQLGDIALPATIKEWTNDAVTCTLPVLGLTRASKATLHVLKADGKTASTLNCELVTTLPTSVETRQASATTSDIEAAKYEQ